MLQDIQSGQRLRTSSPTMVSAYRGGCVDPETLTTLEKILYGKLTALGAAIREDGFPVFPENLLFNEIPSYTDMMTFANRSCVTSTEHTLLCSFTEDKQIVRRIYHIEKDAREYQRHLGFCGFDLSPRGGTPLEFQERALRVNAMANTLLAILSGKKMLANFRIGSILTINALSLYPKGIPYAVGALGCARGNTSYNCAYLKTKLAFARPSELLIYGTLIKPYRKVLEEEAIPFRVIPDFRQRSFARKAG